MLYNFDLLKAYNREFELFLRNKLGIAQRTSEKEMAPLLLELLVEDKTVDEIIDIVRNEDPDNPTYDISEPALTNLGYKYIEEKQLNDGKKYLSLA